MTRAGLSGVRMLDPPPGGEGSRKSVACAVRVRGSYVGPARRVAVAPRDIAGLPTPGQHNAEIFGTLLGADDRQLAEWSAKGII